MPATKNQDIRLEVLDELLSIKKWTLEELLDRVNEKIGDNLNTINKRTLFRDIKYLGEQKNAPIHRPQKGDDRYYYTENFSLKNIPLDEDDIASLKNAIQILKQVDNFYLSKEVDDVIRKLENRVHIQSNNEAVLVQFEKHTSSLGNEHITDLLEAIKSRVSIRIAYQPYLHPTPSERTVHPYLLKEFRNRWFLIGREEGANRITNYSLDRIKKIKPSAEKFIENDFFDPIEYFKHLIGVSVPEGAKPENIEIKVYKQAVPYILSKPVHLNQEKIKDFKDGTILIRLNLIINYELKSILLSYGDGIEVKKPKSLRDDLQLVINGMQAFYEN
ncbi:MAG: WYL domain-containing protein [Cyclobacteriaceae bacterium]